MSPDLSLPRRARRRVGGLVRRARASSPLVTVVVDTRGSEALARATLESVRRQPVQRLEILTVVTDDALRPLVEMAEREDPRVRTVQAAGADAATARRTGVAAAKGSLLVFLSTRQVLLDGALSAMLQRRPGPGGVVAGTLTGGGGRVRTPLLGLLMVSRERWAAVHDDGEPDGQTVAIELMAGGFTELDRPTLRDVAVRRQPFERIENPLPGLESRIGHDNAMLARLTRRERHERAAGAIARDLPRFLTAVERCDDEQWERLAEHANALVESAGDELASVPVEDRAAAFLAARGRRQDLVEYVAARRFANGHFPTSVTDGQVRAELELVDVPDPVLRVGESESPVRAQVRRSRVLGDRLALELLVAVRRVEAVDPQVSVRLEGGGAAHRLDAECASDAHVTRWMAEPYQCHHRGVVRCEVPLDLLTVGAWTLEVDVVDRGVRRSGPVAELDRNGSAGRPAAARRQIYRWVADPSLELVVEPGQVDVTGDAAVVRSARVGPGELRVILDAPGVADVSLESAKGSLAGRREGDEWVIELAVDPWGLGRHPAPPGTYRLRASTGADDVRVSLHEDFAGELPLPGLDALHRHALWRGPRGGLVLRLDPPVPDDDAGPWAQRRLQRRYLEVVEPLDPRLVYFQAFTGHPPTDHPAAIQAELVRVLSPEGPVRMLWGAADSSVRAPHGAERVQLRTREWYDVLARAQWIVSNIELEPWFRRREGQEILQTYHGYPSKAMGLVQWRRRGMTDSHVQQMLQRTSGTWNNLVTPIPEMNRHYRENYAFEGRIIAQGYPRDDALVAPGHEERRLTARRRLVIADHQRAVLYAPTWRDDLATNFRRAQAAQHLDLERVVQALGPDHVVLVRGHRFHSAGAGGARILDVTDYPEINDLILAADAAVLDYSSLRFDFALTGRPMVFLVPDLESYATSTRGFLYPFEESAPGPLVRTTDEVIEELRDLPRLRARWAPEIAAFNAHYNRLADGLAASRVVAEFFAPLLGD